MAGMRGGIKPLHIIYHGALYGRANLEVSGLLRLLFQVRFLIRRKYRFLRPVKTPSARTVLATHALS